MALNFYFVTGLPRMRSAWLANLLTWGSSLCYHEGLNHFSTPSAMFNAMEMRVEDNVGDCSSGLPLYCGDVNRRFPDAKWVVVHRDTKDAMASYIKHFTANPDERIPVYPPTVKVVFDACQSGLADMGKLPLNRLDVNYEDLKRESKVVEIWNFLLPDIMFPGDRCAMLQTIGMNMIPGKIHKLKGEFSWDS